MEWYHVYLFTRLDGISILFYCFTGISGLSSFVFAMAWSYNHEIKEYGKEYKAYKKIAKRGFVISISSLVLFMILTVATPTQKEAAAIYLLPKIANSDFVEEAQQIPTDAAKLMRMKLESWIADMEPKTKGDK